MEGSRLFQIFMFKILQYYGPLRRSTSVKFSAFMFYIIIAFSSLFGGVLIRSFYGLSEMSEKELVNIISITFSSVMAMGIFLGLKGGVTALEPEIDFILTSSIRPSTYLLADLFFQFVFLNFAITPSLISFFFSMLYPHFKSLPLLLLSYEVMLLASSAIAQTLGVLKSIWKDIKVEALGWIIVLVLFMPLLSIAMGLGVNYSDLPYPSTILSRYAIGSLNIWEIIIGSAYLALIVGAYYFTMRVNFLPNIAPLLTTALMEMPSSNRRMMRWVPRLFMQILSPKMSEKPMALVIKLNLLRILRDGSLFTALILFAIATLANLSFPFLIRQARFFTLATLTFNVLYTPLIPSIFSINWALIERETLWTIALSEDGFKKYVKGMLIAYFTATFSFALLFYIVFNIILAGTPFLMLDFLLLLSITLFSSILSVTSALTLTKPSNALSFGALLYVFIPLFGALFLSMPVISARTTISIADAPPPMILLILILYTLLMAFLLSKYTLIRSKTFFDQNPIKEEFPKMQFQRNYRNYPLNFLILVSLTLMGVGLIGSMFGTYSDPSRAYGLPIAILTGLMLATSITLQNKVVNQKDESASYNIPQKVPWKGSQVILILLLSLFLSLILELPILMLTISSPIPKTPGIRISDLLLLVFGEIAMIIPVLLYMTYKKISIEFIGLDSRKATHEFILALLLTPLVVLIGILSGLLVQTLIPAPTWFERMFEAISPSSLGDLVILSLSSIFFTASCEEILFRGFVQRGFESSLGDKWGIMLSAISFGIFHLNPWQFLPAFLLGLVLGYVFRKRNYRLWCPMALHGLYDVSIFLIAYVLRI